MNDFDYDVRQKKQLAASARHRVNGSKRQRCSLPSDNLTPRQLARLSGPCVSVKMNAPTTWKEFKPIPDNLKREYLVGLRDRYGVSQAKVAEMMGVNRMTICMLYKRLNIDAQRQPSTPEERKAKREEWERFLSQGRPEVSGFAENMDHEVETSAAADMTGDDPESNPGDLTEARTIRRHMELDLGYIETPSDLLMLLQHTPILFPGEIRIIVSGETPI